MLCEELGREVTGERRPECRERGAQNGVQRERALERFCAAFAGGSQDECIDNGCGSLPKDGVHYFEVSAGLSRKIQEDARVMTLSPSAIQFEGRLIA